MDELQDRGHLGVYHSQVTEGVEVDLSLLTRINVTQVGQPLQFIFDLAYLCSRIRTVKKRVYTALGTSSICVIMWRDSHRDIIILLMVLVFVLNLIRGRIVGRRLGQLHLRHVFVCTFLVSNALVELRALIFLNFLLTRHSILIVGRGLLLCTGLGFQGLWIGR